MKRRNSPNPSTGAGRRARSGETDAARAWTDALNLGPDAEAGVPRAETVALVALTARMEQMLAGADDLPPDARERLAGDARSALAALMRPEPDFAGAAQRLASMRVLLDGPAASAPSAAAVDRLLREAERLVATVL